MNSQDNNTATELPEVLQVKSGTIPRIHNTKGTKEPVAYPVSMATPPDSPTPATPDEPVIEVDNDIEDEFIKSIQSAKDLLVKNIETPPELIAGILYRGGKMSINAPSKMGKTWTLLHLGLSMASGINWLGFKCNKSKVLFVNPELQNFSFEKRIQMIAKNMNGELSMENFHYVSTRGKYINVTDLIDALKKLIATEKYDAIIFDSIYKFYPVSVGENDNSNIALFLNQLEQLTKNGQCSVIYSHHFSKGNQSMKAAIDRASGAGVWGRDPDAIITATEHEKANSYTVEFNLRDFKPVNPIVITANWPNITRDNIANPKSLRTAGYNSKYDANDILNVVTAGRIKLPALQKKVNENTGMTRSTFFTFWKELKVMPGMDEDKDGWLYSNN